MHIDFGTTPIRRLANWLAVLSVLLWLGQWLWSRGRGDRRRLSSPLLVAAVLAIGLLAAQPLTAYLARPARVANVQAAFGNGVRLLCYSLERARYHPGDTIDLTLFWLTPHLQQQDLKIFVHLRHLGDTQMAGQHDGASVYGFTPLTRWSPGEVIDDAHPIALAPELATGTYQVVVGLYDPVTLQNAPLLDAPQTLPGERVVLGTVEIHD